MPIPGKTKSNRFSQVVSSFATSSDTFLTCKDSFRCYPTDVVHVDESMTEWSQTMLPTNSINNIKSYPSHVFSPSDMYGNNQTKSLVEEKPLDVSQTIQQLVELIKNIEDLKKQKSTLLTAALELNVADAVDVFFKHCMATRIALLETNRQLEQIAAGTYASEPMEYSSSTSRDSGFSEFSRTSSHLRRKDLEEAISKETEKVLNAIVSLNNNENEDKTVYPSKFSKNMNAGGVLFCVGGQDSSPATRYRAVQVYDAKNNKWIKMGQMNEERKSVTLVEAERKLYAIGGKYKSSDLCSAEVFDPETGSWQSIAPMNNMATGGKAAHVNGAIYVIGGCWAVSQKYDIYLNQWTHIHKMHRNRLDHGCAVLDGMVYAVGGHNAGNPVNTCERFNAHLNRWEDIASMSQKRTSLGVCVLDDHIYAVGGRYDLDGTAYKILSSVERYDSKTDTWTRVADLCSPRMFPAVAVLDGLIYAMGGVTIDARNMVVILKSVEVYSPVLDTWSPIADLNEPCVSAGAAWVDCSLDTLLAGPKETEDSENATGRTTYRSCN